MRDKKTSKYGATVISEATEALINFCTENEYSEFLMFFILIGDDYISKDKENARKKLIDIYKDPTNEVSIELVEFFKTDKADKIFDKTLYERHFSQMAYSRLVDNFTTYFKEVLAEVVLKKPQILKSKDQEKLDFILSHETMEDFIRAVSEKKIEELFYKGISDIEKFFEDKLGISIFKNIETRKAINRLIKQRNLIVHNRGKISKEFVKEFPELKLEVGHYLTFQYENISTINLYLNNFLIELDCEIADKFNLNLKTLNV